MLKREENELKEHKVTKEEVLAEFKWPMSRCKIESMI